MVAISEKAKKFNELFKQRLNRQHVLSLNRRALTAECATILVTISWQPAIPK